MPGIYDNIEQHLAPALQTALAGARSAAAAAEALSRRLRAGIDDGALADLVLLLHEEGRLYFTPDQDDQEPREPVIVCSRGMR